MYKIMCNTKDTVHYALFLQEALQKGPGGIHKKKKKNYQGGGIGCNDLNY